MTDYNYWEKDDPFAYFLHSRFLTADMLSPLIGQLKACDQARKKLHRQFTLHHLKAYQEQLQRTFTLLQLSYDGEDLSFRLQQPKGINDFLSDYSWKLEVRMVRLFPTYCLLRYIYDYRENTGYVLEESYKSEDFPRYDTRLIQLRHWGKERLFINLSTLREPFRQEFLRKSRVKRHAADRRLLDLAWPLAAIWQQETYLPWKLAQYLPIKHFKAMVELIDLVLCSEITALRQLSPDSATFFTSVYPNPAVARFLRLLPLLQGDQLESLFRRTRSAYASMAGCFAVFMETEVQHSPEFPPLPLWKYSYAHLKRLDGYLLPVVRQPKLLDACRQLEGHTQHITEAFFDF